MTLRPDEGSNENFLVNLDRQYECVYVFFFSPPFLPGFLKNLPEISCAKLIKRIRNKAARLRRPKRFVRRDVPPWDWGGIDFPRMHILRFTNLNTAILYDLLPTTYGAPGMKRKIV